MAARFMRIKRVVIPLISLVILTSQLAGCAALSPKELVEESQQVDEIVIEYNQFSPTEVEKESTEEHVVRDIRIVTKIETSDENKDEDEIGLISDSVSNDDTVEPREPTEAEKEEIFKSVYDYCTIFSDLGLTDEDVLEYELAELRARFDSRMEILTPEDIEDQYKTWRPAAQDQNQGQNQIEQPNEQVAEAQLFIACNETVYATGTVNIRASYTVNSAKLGSLVRGQTITRTGIGINEAAGWSQVCLADGTTAYMVSSYLSTTKPVDRPSRTQSNQNVSGGQSSNRGNQSTATASTPGIVIDYGGQSGQVKADESNTKSAQDAGYKPGDPSNYLYG